METTYTAFNSPPPVAGDWHLGVGEELPPLLETALEEVPGVPDHHQAEPRPRQRHGIPGGRVGMDPGNGGPMVADGGEPLLPPPPSLRGFGDLTSGRKWW